MIQANELRVGNWVHESTVEIESASWVLKEKQANGNLIKSIELGDIFYPIPITPETLTKYGFKAGVIQTDIEEIETFCLNGIEVFFTISGGICLSEYHVDLYRPKYLHELQNLIFALTNTELEINF